MYSQEKGDALQLMDRRIVAHSAASSDRLPLLLGLLLKMFLVFASCGSLPSWAGCALNQKEIPVRMIDQRPIAMVTLNGTEVPMLVDSGAFFSMLSMSTATQLKLALRSLPEGLRIEGYTGRVDARRARVEKVGLLGAELHNVEFIVGGNELGAGIMGVLGRNILSMADTEYDLAHGVVRLSIPKGECDKTNLAYWAGDAPVVVVPLESGNHRSDTSIQVEVAINGTRMQALFDTGTPQTSLTLSSARRAGIKEDELRPYGRVGGAGEGRATSWTAKVTLFELGGEKVSNTLLQIDDVHGRDYGALVGLDYFLSHRIYVSRLQRQVYVTWNGDPVFALGRAKAGEYDTRYAALPKEVAKDDADALARRGAAAIAAGNHSRAMEDLNRACELAPGVADYFYARARLHLAMAQPRLALADLDEALRLEVGLFEARIRRAGLRESLGNRVGAQADLANLDAALPQSSGLRADMARLFASFNQISEALRQFDLWIRSHQNDARLADVLNSRCWMRARLNVDLPLALSDCKEAVEMDEDAASFRDSLGWTYLRLDNLTLAKKAFDGAIKLKELPFSLFGRGLTQLRMDNVADKLNGERDLAAARKLRPHIDAEVSAQGFDFSQRVERKVTPGSTYGRHCQ